MSLKNVPAFGLVGDYRYGVINMDQSEARMAEDQPPLLGATFDHVPMYLAIHSNG